MSTPLTIGLVSISDRASQGVYEDKGLPALKDWLTRTVTTPMVFETRLIADEQEDIEATLKDLVDHQGCQLVLTTGGTGTSTVPLQAVDVDAWPCRSGLRKHCCTPIAQQRTRRAQTPATRPVAQQRTSACPT